MSSAEWHPLEGGSGRAPHEVARALARAVVGGVVFFDASRAPASLGACSYVTCAPREVLVEGAGVFLDGAGVEVGDPARWMRERAEVGLGAEGFAGGVAGALGFEAAWLLDPPRAPRLEARTPALWVGWFPTVLRYSHARGSWAIAGPRDSHAGRLLEGALDARAPREFGSLTEPVMLCGEDPRCEYPRRVEGMVEAIAAGDLFEVNYAERFEARWSGEPYALYEAMREVSTGAHFAYLGAPSFQVCSVSPERFIEVSAGRITARPIKGSRARGEGEVEDAAAAAALLASEKDRAENVMIVDLMRNDLTRVCRLGTVLAEEVCVLESFAGIHHLVSTVSGELEPGVHPIDALLACAPAGSITGAPKLRAIEYIAEREHTARGVYTGSAFWSSGAELDANVLIRTAEVVGGVARYGAGGAVVSDSSPELERDEAWLKARPFLSVHERYPG